MPYNDTTRKHLNTYLSLNGRSIFVFFLQHNNILCMKVYKSAYTIRYRKKCIGKHYLILNYRKETNTVESIKIITLYAFTSSTNVPISPPL